MLVDQFVEFGFTQTVFVQITRLKFGAMREQETSCFAASRSSGLLKVPQLNFGHVSLSIPRHTRIDFRRPAFDAAGHRFRALNALPPQPNRGIETAHPVMAIANHLFRIEKSIQICRNCAEWNQLCSGNSAQIVFPRLAHIDEQKLVSPNEAFVYFLRRDLHVIHFGHTLPAPGR
jgi:hypothetical protein